MPGILKDKKQTSRDCKKTKTQKIPTRWTMKTLIGLSNEVKQKLSEARPQSLARASRLPGVTPAAISLLMVHLKKRKRKRKAS